MLWVLNMQLHCGRTDLRRYYSHYVLQFSDILGALANELDP